MYIKLRCSGCGGTSNVPFSQLYDLWKEKYEKYGKMAEQNRIKARATTRIRCHCGVDDSYNDSLMFSYVFQLIFTELIRNK